MKLMVVGVGPGDPALVTVGALRAVRGADIVLIPHSRDGRPSVAGKILADNLEGDGLPVVPIVFPMIYDAEKRDAELLRQLEELRPRWQGAGIAVLPVIGDSALYATGAFLFDVWRGLVPDLELELIPGVSAHSLAASCARRFLALGDEVLCVIPATAGAARIEAALSTADAAAVYKPSVLKDRLADIVTSSGPWGEIIRVDRAGLPDEQVRRGEEALSPAEEYLSVLLLWRHGRQS